MSPPCARYLRTPSSLTPSSLIPSSLIPFSSTPSSLTPSSLTPASLTPSMRPRAAMAAAMAATGPSADARSDWMKWTSQVACVLFNFESRSIAADPLAALRAQSASLAAPCEEDEMGRAVGLAQEVGTKLSSRCGVGYRQQRKELHCSSTREIEWNWVGWIVVGWVGWMGWCWGGTGWGGVVWSAVG